MILVPASAGRADRIVVSLNGEWQFHREGKNESKTVVLPNSFEHHEGALFDGVGWYEKRIQPFKLHEGSRAILHFQAVATDAEVWFDGKKVGAHLGGWTPFRVDVTDLINTERRDPHLIQIRVDEKVGHNSQGFLPVFAPHFGGVWQDVHLMVVTPTWIDDLAILAIGKPASGSARVVLPLNGNVPSEKTSVVVRHRHLNDTAWSAEQLFHAKCEPVETDGKHQLDLDVPIENWKLWSPRTPNIYELEFQILGDDPPTSPWVEKKWRRVTTRVAFRTVSVEGDKLLLNGNPLGIRGLLNWGYAPPRVAPSIDESHFRKELEFAQSYGFNLMKFCLWVPPKRYLEIADEMGMLTWVEYPTWHSNWSPNQLPTLRREFTEFFHYDRNHPSVVLRSLTCETGPGADLDVIRNLYDLCHQKIPGSVVEDDSSWISWNRVHDFYDDHPYGNNHTWVSTLERLKDHINKHGNKPLVLGEAIAADTWTPCQPLLDVVGDSRPFWLPNFLDGNLQWTELIHRTDGQKNLAQIGDESKHYAMLMRKFQIETYRREVPNGGYVVSVIRDFPFASMGLLDFHGRPKWSVDDWDWHSNSMLILQTENDRRSFSSGERLVGDLLLSHFGSANIRNGQLTVSIVKDPGGPSKDAGILHHQETMVQQIKGSLEKALRFETPAPRVTRPTRFVIRANLSTSEATIRNQWPIWIVPRSEPTNQEHLLVHRSFLQQSAGSPFANAKAWDEKPTAGVVVAGNFDDSLLDFLVSGGNVLMLPNGEHASLPLSDVWFLRGGPYVSRQALMDHIPRQFLVELQHFDLAGSVIPDIKYLEQIDPILLLWHNHDIDRVKTHGLVFETRIGKGRLLVSALNHGPRGNSAGRWLLDAFVRHLGTASNPDHQLSADSIRHIRNKIREKKIDLTIQPWSFKPDPDNSGLQQDWHLPSDTLDRTWKEIQIGSSWEGQGYATLDGWAWYRIQVDIPKDWKGQPIFISMNGVDDHYELYVDGVLAGSGGDLKSRTTAFDETTSHDVTKLIEAGTRVQIAIRVFDWYGAGGIHRPVSVGNTKLEPDSGLLK